MTINQKLTRPCTRTSAADLNLRGDPTHVQSLCKIQSHVPQCWCPCTYSPATQSERKTPNRTQNKCTRVSTAPQHMLTCTPMVMTPTYRWQLVENLRLPGQLLPPPRKLHRVHHSGHHALWHRIVRAVVRPLNGSLVPEHVSGVARKPRVDKGLPQSFHVPSGEQEPLVVQQSPHRQCPWLHIKRTRIQHFQQLWVRSEHVCT